MSHFPAIILSLFASAVMAAAIEPGVREPSELEQYSLQLVNRFRAAPRTELSRMLRGANLSGVVRATAEFTPGGTAWSADFWAKLTGTAGTFADPEFTMDYFQVRPGNLTLQFDNLPAGPLPPLAWNLNLGHSAQEYNALILADRGRTGDPHSIAPYTGYSSERFTDAGYLSPTTHGENVARDLPGFGTQREIVDYLHAAFAVDWGPGNGTGIQGSTGHRSLMLSTGVRECGIGYAPTSYTAGSVSMVQHFGAREGAVFVTGMAWRDLVADQFFTPGAGEALAGLTVTAYAAGTGNLLATATTRTWGGYSLAVPAPVTCDVRLTGPGVDATVRGVSVSAANALVDFRDPGNAPPAGPFAITRAVLTGGTLSLTWESVAGASYRVQASGDLAGWTDISGGIPAGGSTTNTQISGAVSGSRRWFRISRL